MSDAAVARLTAMIDELVRAHRAAAPPPRGLPYLGLEHASGTGRHLLDALAARGIFRKYECVLDLGAGLGGVSRWLAARLGCEVVGTTASVAEAAAASELTRRAGLSAQVRAVAGALGTLPFRSGRFTHVWAVESLSALPDPESALAEAYRALRRGGTLALQELASESRADLVPGRALASPAEHAAALRRAGFVDLELRDRTADAAERSAQTLAARAQLLRRLATHPDVAPLLAEREALTTALTTGTVRVIQILAHRP